MTSNKSGQHFDEIMGLSDKLQTLPIISADEQRLRELELVMVRDNIELILLAAHDIGQQLIKNPIFPVAMNPEELCWQRYIIVPLLYKLGLIQQAAQLRQQTFAALFPRLHLSILQKLDELYGVSCRQKATAILEQFNINHHHIAHSYFRTMKSTNAIWKKIPSILRLQSMTSIDMAETIDDLLAFRWNMKVNMSENRFDALINGIKLLPTNNIIRFRNQQVRQSSGFDQEPLMKFYYQIDGMPVECQLLGGDIEYYMSAKGYSNYKLNFTLPPTRSSLTSDQYNARLGLCLHYQEQHHATDYHQLMLQELIAKKPLEYNNSHTFLLDQHPSHSKNCTLQFADNEINPIYKLGNHIFTSKAMSLSTTEALPTSHIL